MSGLRFPRPFALAVLIAGLSLPPAAGAQGTPPTTREQQEIVSAVLELGPRATGEDRRRQRELLARLQDLPIGDARAAQAFERRALDAAARLPGLPRGTGRQFLDPATNHGLFFVGGRTQRPTGLLIGMHGGGVGEGDALSARSQWESAANRLGWLAIFPEVLEKTEHGWTTSGTEEFVLELIERALRSHRIPRDRVYLVGHSMGGYGAWTLGARHADRVAGLVATAGAPTPLLDRERNVIDIDWGVIPNLRNTRVVVFQSADDPQVPPDANRMAVRRIEEARGRFGGYDLDYWELPNQGHEMPPGGARGMLDRVESARRVALPERVVWQPVLTWKRRFHWLAWEEPIPGTVIDAQVDRAAGRIEIRVEGEAPGLAVLVGPALVDMDRELVVTLGGEERFRGVPRRSAAVILETALEGDAELVLQARIDLR